MNVIQRQLGHTDLGTTSTYLRGIDPSEIIDAVRARRPPTIPPPPDSRCSDPPLVQAGGQVALLLQPISAPSSSHGDVVPAATLQQWLDDRPARGYRDGAG